MAGRLPPSSLTSHESDQTSDPFADRPRALQFQEPQPRPFESTLSLPQELGGQIRPYDDEEIEKLPLTGGNVPGGFYPPGYV
jgi:chitin synthase